MTITISIQEETWKELNDRKQPGESFDSVIRKALNEIPVLNIKKEADHSALPNQTKKGEN